MVIGQDMALIARANDALRQCSDVVRVGVEPFIHMKVNVEAELILMPQEGVKKGGINCTGRDKCTQDTTGIRDLQTMKGKVV
jgi:hypothetical protein